ncbi:hypothetical protein B9Z48_15185 [Limnohabitans sp. WS1]|nr:hypothetical protein B9Z48_15185 [Limnohabitans sp. WS1]
MLSSSFLGSRGSGDDAEKDCFAMPEPPPQPTHLYGGKIDLLTWVRNPRTSVEMIERFYDGNLMAEMNIELLQGKRT